MEQIPELDKLQLDKKLQNFNILTPEEIETVIIRALEYAVHEKKAKIAREAYWTELSKPITHPKYDTKSLKIYF